jgi:hypothetical protein
VSHNDSSAKLMVYLVFGGISGLKFAYEGFKKWKYKRYLEDIPVSKIGSAAMGLVELEGEAEGAVQLMDAPLSGEKCVFYKYKVEKYISAGRNSYWKTEAEDESSSTYFCVKDETGQVLCAPSGVELLDKPTYYYANNLFRNKIPDRLISFLDNNGITYKQFISNARFQFSEWIIHPDDHICILGSLTKVKGSLDDMSDFKLTLNRRLQAIKADPQAMMAIDTDHDGKVSQEEWDAKVKELKDEVTARAQNIADGSNVAISAGEEEQIFIISRQKRQNLFSILQWQAWGFTFGGSLLSIICIYLLIHFSRTLFTELMEPTFLVVMGIVIVVAYFGGKMIDKKNKDKLQQGK